LKDHGDLPRRPRRRAAALTAGGLVLLALVWLRAAPTGAPRGAVTEGVTTATARTPPPGQSLLDGIPTDGGLVATRWQSTRVLTRGVTLENQPAPGFVGARIPAGGATFAASYGVNPDRLDGLASGPFHFTVAVLTAQGGNGRGERKLLLDEHIDPARQPGDRRWFPLEVDLDRWAGQDVLLVLSVSAATLVDAPGDLAGWAEPRLVPRTPDATAPGS